MKTSANFYVHWGIHTTKKCCSFICSYLDCFLIRTRLCKLDISKIVFSWHSCNQYSANFIDYDNQCEMSDCVLPDGSPQGFVSHLPIPCAVLLCWVNRVSAALGIASVAGPGCPCKSKFPGSPALLIFKGKWGSRLQCYTYRSGCGNFTKKWLCSGWSPGLNPQGIGCPWGSAPLFS